jgi:SpoVK/Ycf46/Vps4 family AAA+-type ATPase
MPAFVLLHGLPGSGKTTAAETIVSLAPEEYFFVNWGRHPEFRKKTVRDLLSGAYIDRADGRSMISEGVLEEQEGRDRLIAAVLAASRETDFPLDDAVVIFIDETDMSLLAGRRSKSAEFYAMKRDKVERGSELYRWERYVPVGESREERAQRLLELIRG